MTRGVRLDPGQVGEAEHCLGARELRVEGRGALRGGERPAQIAERGAQLGDARPRERVVLLELHRLLGARARGGEIEARLLYVGRGDLRRRRIRVGGDRALGRGLRVLVAILRDGDHRLERQRIGIVRRELERSREIGVGLVDAAHREVLRGALCERTGTAFLGRARRENRRVVERPVHRVARPRDQPKRGRFARLGDRRRAGGEHELASGVRRLHAALEDGDFAAPLLDRNEELGAAHACHRVGRVDFEVAFAASAQEVGGAAREIDEILVVLGAGERHLGARAQAQHRLIEERQVCPAAIARAHRVARAQRLIARDRLPITRAGGTDLDRALHRNGAGDRRIARGRRGSFRSDEG